MTRRKSRKSYASYVPNEGILYVDLSGVEGNEDHIFIDDRNRVHLRRLEDFNRRFKERSGLVLTTKESLAEFSQEIGHYKNVRGWKRKIKRRMRSGGNISSFRQIYEDDGPQGKRLQAASRKMYELLGEGRVDFLNGHPGPYDEEIGKYVTSFRWMGARGSDLSLVDRSIVTEALCAGDGTGILTGDVPMIIAYKKGVERFRLQNCFVCNSLNSEAEYCD